MNYAMPVWPLSAPQMPGLTGCIPTGCSPPTSGNRLKLYINQNAAALGTAMRDLLLADPALEAEELDTGWRELNRAQRSALLGLRRDGVISEETFEQLTAEVDAQMDELPALPEEGNAPTQFLEVTIRSDSHAVGKAIAELDLPRSGSFRFDPA